MQNEMLVCHVREGIEDGITGLEKMGWDLFTDQIDLLHVGKLKFFQHFWARSFWKLGSSGYASFHVYSARA